MVRIKLIICQRRGNKCSLHIVQNLPLYGLGEATAPLTHALLPSCIPGRAHDVDVCISITQHVKNMPAGTLQLHPVAASHLHRDPPPLEVLPCTVKHTATSLPPPTLYSWLVAKYAPSRASTRPLGCGA